MSNSAARIADVATAPRDDVNVSVRDRVSRRLAALDADIETVDPRLCANPTADPLTKHKQARPLVSRESWQLSATVARRTRR